MIELYDSWYERLQNEGSHPFSRTRRLFTLGIVARKCNVRKSVIERDLRLLFSAYSKLPGRSVLTLSECEKTFYDGYEDVKFDCYSYELLCILAEVDPECLLKDRFREAFPVVEEFAPLRNTKDDIAPEDLFYSDQLELFDDIPLEKILKRLNGKK